MKYLLILCLAFLVSNCKNGNSKEDAIPVAISKDSLYSDTIINSKDFREFKVLDSKYINNQSIWKELDSQLSDFSETIYQQLKPLILEKDIPTLQNEIKEGKLTYELLTKFYLYRIRIFDRENKWSLNSVIALNPNVVEQARERDEAWTRDTIMHPVYGMPILLKDNINTLDMPTTAGSVALQNNHTSDAFIVKQLKDRGALILGKANLSEWAYFFCEDCPSGYSAIGGQTLNPYGRRELDTGGSSSGSAVAVAANFCVAAIGSETSGSILSPSSQNSVVGLKPTIGLLSRNGIVPISSTLDTPGPITKNVIDNAIVLDAMFGEDFDDSKSIYSLWEHGFYYDHIRAKGLNGRRFGAFKKLMNDSLYANALKVLKSQGATIVEIDEEDIELPDFLRLLNLDMKKDLPQYLSTVADSSLKIKSVDDVIAFNDLDSITRSPYGQDLFKGIIADSSSLEKFDSIKKQLYANGKLFFDRPLKSKNLDGILSINNYHAGFAAVAEYPAITVPMGYKSNGEPEGLTFIAVRLQEKFLLQWAFDYEKASDQRKTPINYN